MANKETSLGTLRPFETTDIEKLNLDVKRETIVYAAEGLISDNILKKLISEDPQQGFRQLTELTSSIPEIPNMLRNASNLESIYTLEQLQKEFPVVTKKIKNISVWGWLSEKPLLQEALINKKKNLSSLVSETVKMPTDSTILLSIITDLTNIRYVIRTNNTDILVEAHELCGDILDLLHNPKSQEYRLSDPKELLPDQKHLGDLSRKLLTIRRVLNKIDIINAGSESKDENKSKNIIVNRDLAFNSEVDFWFLLQQFTNSEELDEEVKIDINKSLRSLIDNLVYKFPDRISDIKNIFGSIKDSGILKKESYIEHPGASEMEPSEIQNFLHGGND